MTGPKINFSCFYQIRIAAILGLLISGQSFAVAYKLEFKPKFAPLRSGAQPLRIPEGNRLPDPEAEEAFKFFELPNSVLKIPFVAASPSLTLVIDGIPQPKVSDGRYLTGVVALSNQKCHAVTAVFAKGGRQKDYPYELCIDINPEVELATPYYAGPFAYRKKFHFWLQGGTSFLFQTASNSTGSSLNARQLALRAGTGVVFKNIEAETNYRSQIKTLSAGSDYKPSWLQVSGGYGFELPRFSVFTPRVSLLAGLEIYKNKIASSSTSGNYIAAYTAPTVGFRSRFIVKTRLEIGGDFYLTLLSGTSKYFIQGDMRYWLTKNVALGGGYWIDTAHVTTGTANFDEVSYALETYLKVAF